MNWTKEQYENHLARKAPNARNKPVVPHEPLGKKGREEENTERIALVITARRRRLLDVDGPCPKYFIDGLRYAGLLPDDRPQDVTLQLRQEKVESKDDEETVIEISYPNTSKQKPK
jgi:hypothetical protein